MEVQLGSWQGSSLLGAPLWNCWARHRSYWPKMPLLSFSILSLSLTLSNLYFIFYILQYLRCLSYELWGIEAIMNIYLALGPSTSVATCRARKNWCNMTIKLWNKWVGIYDFICVQLNGLIREVRACWIFGWMILCEGRSKEIHFTTRLSKEPHKKWVNMTFFFISRLDWCRYPLRIWHL